MARVMALALVVGLFPAGMAQSASAVELPEDEIKEMWEIALENGYTHYDTIDLCGGNSHKMCIRDSAGSVRPAAPQGKHAPHSCPAGRSRRPRRTS